MSKKPPMHNRLWIISCAANKEICEKYRVTPDDRQAVVEAWGSGGATKRYQGPLTPRSVVKFVKGFINAEQNRRVEL